MTVYLQKCEDFCEISMVRLALIPIKDPKNNVIFAIYAKTLRLKGKKSGRSGHIYVSINQ